MGAAGKRVAVRRITSRVASSIMFDGVCWIDRENEVGEISGTLIDWENILIISLINEEIGVFDLILVGVFEIVLTRIMKGGWVKAEIRRRREWDIVRDNSLRSRLVWMSRGNGIDAGFVFGFFRSRGADDGDRSGAIGSGDGRSRFA